MIEWYGNNLHATGAPDTIARMLTLRGGTAVIYNNTIDNASAKINFYEEEQYLTSNWSVSRTGWPAEDQVHNTFVWGNTFGGGAQEDSDVATLGGSTDYIRQNYEYFTHAPATTGSGETLGKMSFWKNSDCVANNDPHICCTGSGTGDCRNGASDSYPTDGNTYANYGTMYWTADVENEHYGYKSYTCPHPDNDTSSSDLCTAQVGDEVPANAIQGVTIN